MPIQTRTSIQRATQSKTTRQQDGGLATAQSTSASQTMTPTEVKQDKSKRPPRKRARCSISESMEPVAASTERVPAEHSHLAGLFNVPIDILAEIAVYLHPVDLVYLSRTSKFFRNILMNRASAYIWRSAGLNVQNLPPCPKDISELQYAALLFTESCSICGDHAFRLMDPILLVRLCPRCHKEQAVGIHRVTDSSLVFRSPSMRKAWPGFLCYKYSTFYRLCSWEALYTRARVVLISRC
ncbi:hypothetical protein FRC12_022230 [Ceratobasidium sp. 428]|nr:hypothetical protein FRC12_022230 [Ceratobasidium sp. 428]